jgi:peroxiredoxin
MVDVGQMAPDFTLTDQDAQQVTLSAHASPTLVVFIPAAFTPVCGGELQALRPIAERARVLAVSCDSMFTLRALADAEGIEFTLLSDFWPHGEVARAYDAFDDVSGMARRVSLLIDGGGRVTERWQSRPGQARDADDYLRALHRPASG